MAYDSARKVVVFFGGVSASGDLGDTWEWNGAAGTWTQRQPTVSPPALEGHGMAYDPNRHVTVLAGGVNVFPPPTWEWNGTQWTQGVGTAPYGLTHLVYDSVHASVRLMVTQLDFVTVWEWQPSPGPGWVQLSGPCGPAMRGGFAVGYDPVAQQTLMYGGEFNPGTPIIYDDLWAWKDDGSGWRQYQKGTGAWPPGMFNPSSVYEPTHGFLVFDSASNFWQVQFL